MLYYQDSCQTGNLSLCLLFYILAFFKRLYIFLKNIFMDYSPLTDSEIAQRYGQDANPRLFAELVRRHQPSVLRQCRYQLNDPSAAHDVSQEVWIRVFTKFNQFQTDRCFATWLSSIVHNRCHDHNRSDKGGLNKELSHNVMDTLIANEVFDNEQVTKPTVEDLAELMECLSGSEKLLLHKRYREGWSVADIQHSTQLSESAVKSRLFELRKKLQKL